MAIYKRGQIWYIDYYQNGRRIRDPAGPKKYMAVDLLAERKVSRYKKPIKDILFSDFAKEYAEHSKANKKSWEKELYSINGLLSAFGHNKLSQVTTREIEQYKLKRLERVSKSTVNRNMSCLKHMYQIAIQWGYINSNPAKSIKQYREIANQVRVLSPEEEIKLLNNTSEHLEPIIITALNTGMRKSELLNLKWNNIDFKDKTIYLQDSKSGESAKIPMNIDVYNALKSLKKASEYIFTFKNNKIADIKKGWYNAVKKSGIPKIRFHDLRHTFGSRLVQNGVDIVTVKELMRHKTIEMTMRYTHTLPEHKVKAVEILSKQYGHKSGQNDKSKLNLKLPKTASR